MKAEIISLVFCFWLYIGLFTLFLLIWYIPKEKFDYVKEKINSVTTNKLEGWLNKIA